MNAEEAAAAILDVSGDAEDLQLEEDGTVSFEDHMPHRSRDPLAIAQDDILVNESIDQSILTSHSQSPATAAEESDSPSEDDDESGSSDDDEGPRYQFRGLSTRLADLVAAQDGSFLAFGDRDNDSSDDDDDEPRYRFTERRRRTRSTSESDGGGRRQNRRDDSDDSDEWTEDWDDVHRQEFSSRDGPSRIFAGEIDAITCFGLFFTEVVWELLVVNTNLYAAAKYTPGHSRTWSPVVVEEMKAFFGLLILMGYMRFPRIEDYWQKAFPILESNLSDIMTLTRFMQILRFFHVCDPASERQRGDPAYDKLQKKER
ncbi:piggyBac transposable element-derived protein 5-like [Oscarella lobularis]|uniref:piggyBac transposable element-derived protein 5-like n=1 Tax=Oscarella lobularis TaxID=121494 RepID=UPI003313D4E9